MRKREVVFIDGVRTAFGKMGGSLRNFSAEELGGIGIKGLVKKTGILDRANVDTVMLGTALGAKNAINPARWASLYAGLPQNISASYVEMQCGSAIDAINHSAWKILSDQADVVIAGGMEAYSQATVRFSTAVEPFRMTAPAPLEQQLAPNDTYGTNMGLTAENLQEMYKIPRSLQDEFAYRSQDLAKKAIEAGYFEEEIISVSIPQGKKKPPVDFCVDEFPRLSPMDVLASLPPVFKKDGTVTAGNSSGRNDGSSFVLMMSREKAEKFGYKPMAKWLSGADYGVDPGIMGIAPAYAIPIALKRAGLKLSDIDVIECNEAFAVQNLAVMKELENQTGEKVNFDSWNPNGGAIAFGHPNGASGSRICIFAMRELIRRSARYAVFSSCCGGGQGVATIIENLQR